MGVTSKTIEICSCDLCGAECDKHDGDIAIQVNSGDGRDVGPALIRATMTLYQPYKCVNGVVCRECKVKWLKQYVEKEQHHD